MGDDQGETPFPRRVWESLIERSLDLVVLTDDAGVVRAVSASSVQLIGYASHELVGRTMTHLLVDDDADKRADLLATLLATPGGVVRVRATLRHKNGTPRTFDTAAHNLVDDPGVRGMVAFLRDVTDAVEAERALALSERRFRALTERSGAGIALTDAEGIIFYVTSVSPLDVGPEERLGKSIFARVHEDDLAGLRELFECVVATPGSSLRADVRLRHRGGGWRWLDASYTNMLHDPAVGGVVINYRDVTERVMAEEHLRKAHRLEAIGRLAAGVAHDFNNLLVGILGYASLLSANLDDPARLEEVEQIRIAGERAADLTRQILAFSRRQLLKRERVDINAMLTGLVKLLRRVTRANVEIDLVTAPDLPAVYADAGQLEHAIVNLAVNASDAMPDGGRLGIATACIDVPFDPSDRDFAPGPHVSIRVSDTGLGMAPEVVQHIFEPFFTTKELGRGTGLGLATVHGVVHQHGGRIRVESQVGRGSTFDVLLPAAADALTPAPRPAPIAARGGEELILVADDDEIARRITVRLLERAGYRVLLAHNGAEALARFSRHGDEIDLVLLDVVMPDMAGPEVLRRMEALRPGVRFLFASGYAWEPGEADERIVRSTLQKPFDLDELLRRVRAALEG